MRRRDFIQEIVCAAAAWPLAASAQQPTMPIVGFVSGRSADTAEREVAAFTPMRSSSPAASNLRRLRRAMGFPRPIPLATKSKPAD
jgi:hypothetical protein